MDGVAQLRFSANISDGFLFSEENFLDRYAAAKAGGFNAVECAFPVGPSLEQVVTACTSADISQVHLNMPAGDWAAGERGFAAVPGREEDFKESVELALKYAELLKCKRLHAMAGSSKHKLSYEEASQWRQTYISNLRWAAQRLSEAGVLLLIEPISNAPNYFLQHQQDALDIIAEVKHPNIKLQFDFYHAQRRDGNLADFLSENISSIGHIQVGQVPGRHEPNQPGELNFSFLFKHLVSLGYDGWIGCEYKPAGNTAEGLKWLTGGR